MCDPTIFAFHQQMEARIARLLQVMHPHWERASGACPVCVYDAVQRALSERSPVSLRHELQSPFPVFAADEARLLPTTERLRANPNYAGRRITIAFLDSGFYPHPDLTRPHNRILRYVDATENEPVEKEYVKQPRVESWHGTMTSCVGAGNGFMSDGLYRGLAHQANVVLVKTGSRTRRIHDRDIARALEWVIANHERDHIRIVNISLGGDLAAVGQLSELDQLVEEAVALGIVVVAAAGNGGRAHVNSPASAPSAITVGGLDDQNTLDRAHWRMYPSANGHATNGARKPELIAPAIWLAAPMLLATETHNEGMFLWRLLQSSDAECARTLETKIAKEYFKQRTLRLPIDEIRQMIRTRMIEQKFIHAHYQHVDGTSFAAPIVSSVAAQMLEANPTLTPADVKTILVATAEPLDQLPVEQQGHGVVNAARAVAAALRAPHGPLTGLPLSPEVTPWALTFTLHAENARQVALVGSFNDWQPRGYAMRDVRRGIWQITLPALAAGTYPYKFLLDGERWVNDTENGDVVADGYGGFHSVLTV
ncbi:MAG: S8 family serine peptidase [Chloroflexota bacterium]